MRTQARKQGWLIILILVISGPVAYAQLARNSQEVWPSIDAYYRINEKFRLYGTAGGSKSDGTNFSESGVGIYLDYFTFPLVKKLYPQFTDRHADSLPGKYVWFRVGYHYTASPPSAEDPFQENMLVTEANGRYYLPWKMLMTVKNRFDWRMSNGTFNGRYRPRIMLEKDLKTDYLTFTATGYAEYYVNFGNNPVNRLRTQLGVELRALRNVNYEVFWSHQFAHEPEIQSVDAFGMCLKFYLTRSDFNWKWKKKKKTSTAKPEESVNPL